LAVSTVFEVELGLIIFDPLIIGVVIDILFLLD
jgi:hypothetical protein